MIGGLCLHPIKAGPSSWSSLEYLSILKVVANKFLYPKGSLLLTSLEDASHLILEVARDSSLISLRQAIPERITYRWIGAKESMNPPLLIKVLCHIMAGKDFGGSPLTQISSPISLFRKVL
jgi:hypothetical protein